MPSVKASFRLVKTVVLLFGFLITRESFATTAADKSGGLEHEKPRNVVAEVINGTGISLRWEAPKAATPSCPLKGYIVRLKTDFDKRPKRWTVDADRHALKLYSLLEGTTYHVRVLAVLCNGKMAHSNWVTVQTRKRPDRPANDVTQITGSALEDRPPGKPLVVKVRTFSDSVLVSWLPPEEDIVVRGYMIGYGEGVPDVNWQYVDNRSRNLTINNLKPSTQYVISIRAFNNVDKGPVVYDLVHTREKAVAPSNPVTSTPTNLRARVLSSSTVWLQWTDPSLGSEQQIMDNRYYNVHYQALPHGKTLSVIVKALHVVLYDLTPGTEYSFKVRSINDAKSSPFSLMVLNKTLEAAPGSPPVNVEAVVNNTTVIVKWKPPIETNGEISGYLLSYTDALSKNNTDWTVIGVEGWMSETSLSELKPDTTYQLKIQARNSMGYGPLSPVISFRTAPAAISLNSPALDESVHDGFSEEVVDDMMVKVKNDQIETEPSSKVKNQLELEPVKGRDTSKVKEERQPINVVRSAARVIDNSDDTPKTAAITAPPPLDLAFNAVVRHTVNAVLTFKPPCDADKSTSLTYRVRMLDFAQAQEVRVIPVEAGTVLLEGLKPWRVYRYQVEAVDETGQIVSVSKEATIDTKP